VRTLSVIPWRREGRKRQGDGFPPAQPWRHRPTNMWRHVGQRFRGAFTPLIDAKAASQLLGVPYTWLLAQARAGSIPHHRLGHYVRFNPDDLHAWLEETKLGPQDPSGHGLADRASVRNVA
jgi:excisionase family DNA binding protein